MSSKPLPHQHVRRVDSSQSITRQMGCERPAIDELDGRSHAIAVRHEEGRASPRLGEAQPSGAEHASAAAGDSLGVWRIDNGR